MIFEAREVMGLGGLELDLIGTNAPKASIWPPVILELIFTEQPHFACIK